MALWNKTPREEPMVPMRCPWCGGEMKRGYLTSGRDAVYFSEEKPGMVEYLIRGAGWLRLDNEGGSVNTYKTAWHCPACRKLVVDTADIRPKGEWPELGQTPEPGSGDI